MLERYGRFVVRRRRWMLAAVLVMFGGGVVAAVSLQDRLSLEVFVVKKSEANRGKEALLRDFGVASPNVVLLITPRSGSVDAPANAARARAVAARLRAERGITNFVSYWSRPHPRYLRSKSGRRALVVARLQGDDKHVDDRIRDIAPRFRADSGPLRVRVGGSAEFIAETSDVFTDDLTRAELATAPVTLLALLFIFGSLVAAALPLVMAVFVVVGTSAVLWALTFATSVSAYALFFTTVLGLGLAIDYSLFLVSRFREELNATGDVEAAVVRTVQTAGHAVLFSATTVAVALAGQLFIPLNFMKSLGYAAIATALVAGLSALLVLPPTLAVLGPKVNRLSVRRGAARGSDGRGFWYRTAMRVMRHPVLVAVVMIGAIVVVASPALRFAPGLIDDRNMDDSIGIRQTGDVLRRDFSGRESTPILVVLPDTDARRDRTRVDALARRIRGLDGVTRVQIFTKPGGAYFSVVSRFEPLSDASKDLVSEIRALPTPIKTVLVTGEAANAKDVTHSVVDAIPWAIAFVVIASYLALMVQFRSVVAPLISILLSLGSIGVLFGALVYIFQEGHLADVLNFTPTGTIYINLPVFLFCFAYGLAMDYQVFIFSRIREEYDKGARSATAIARGLGRSGPIMTAAATLIALVFLSSGVLTRTLFGRSFGLGLGLIVLLDAFIMRGTLVPALMKLAGRANWWAPPGLRRRPPTVLPAAAHAAAAPQPVAAPAYGGNGAAPVLAAGIVAQRLRLLADEARILCRELPLAGTNGCLTTDDDIAEFLDRSLRVVRTRAPAFAEFYASKPPYAEMLEGAEAHAQLLGYCAIQLDHISRRVDAECGVTPTSANM